MIFSEVSMRGQIDNNYHGDDRQYWFSGSSSSNSVGNGNGIGNGNDIDDELMDGIQSRFNWW